MIQPVARRGADAKSNARRKSTIVLARVRLDGYQIQRAPSRAGNGSSRPKVSASFVGAGTTKPPGSASGTSAPCPTAAKPPPARTVLFRKSRRLGRFIILLRQKILPGVECD